MYLKKFQAKSVDMFIVVEPVILNQVIIPIHYAKEGKGEARGSYPGIK